MKEASSGDMPWSIAGDERPDLAPEPVFPPPAVWATGSYPGGVAGRKRGMVNERALSWESAQPATWPQIKPRQSMVSSHFDENGFLLWVPSDDDDDDDDDESNVDGPGMEESTEKGLPPWLQDKNADSKGSGSDSKSGSSDSKGGSKSGSSGSKSSSMASKSSSSSSSSSDSKGSSSSTKKTKEEEAELSTKSRDKMDKSSFAIPSQRAYPIPDIEHARNALSRVAQNGTPAEQKQVRAAVYRKFPQLKK